jgi:hypothetical protein
MMRSRWVAPVGLGLILLLFPGGASAAAPFRYPEARHGKGELKYLNGLPVLVVEGTPEQIGEQIGALTPRALARLLGFSQAFLDAHGLGSAWPQLTRMGKVMLPQFPADYRKELQAMTRSSRLDFETAVVGNIFPDLKKIGGCSTLIVEPNRSATGRLLFGRNLDYPTLDFLHLYTLVTVYRPRGKHAFASVGFPGLLGCLSGMNDAGLSLATLEVYRTRDGAPLFDPRGVPYLMTYRRILEECTTVAEAEKLLRSVKRTTLNNLAICDRQGGAVFEITPKSVVVRRSADGICPCTNHFCTRELGTGVRCRRLNILCECRALKTIGLADVAKKLDGVNQGSLTLQTMIFEPAALRLHLAIGKCPSSKLPLKRLDLGPLLKRN